MNTEQTKPEASDIAQKIFNQLIIELKKTEVPLEIVGQLEKEIIVNDNFSEQVVRTALSLNSEI